MEELKKSEMEDWRKYLGINGNAAAKDVLFEIIEKAIMVAKTHYPVEFQIQRQKIAKTLFSLNSSSDDVDHEEEINIGCKEKMNFSQRQSQSQSGDVVNNHHHINYSTSNHEETEMVTVTDEVLRIKQVLDTDRDRDESESVVDVYELLLKLQQMSLSYKILEATKIGRSASAFQNHGSNDVRLIARRLIKMWRAVADQWFQNQQQEEEEKEESIIKGAAAEKKQMVSTGMMKKECSNVVKIKIINRNSVAKMEDKSTTTTTTTTINNNSNIEKKLEATKRKLHQRYEEVENAKRQRKMQVVELHQLKNQGFISSSKTINQNRKSLKMW